MENKEILVKEDKMVSLFDYLKRPAGPKLGKEVYEFAKKYKVKYGVRENINAKNYSGKILIYPKSFLDIYFQVLKTA